MRARLLNHIKPQFKTLEEAEEHYNLTLSNVLEDMDQGVSVSSTPVKVVDKVTQTVSVQGNEANVVVDESQLPVSIESFIASLDNEELIQLANQAFLELAVKSGINSNPANFAELAVESMRYLQVNGKNNLLYKFAFCLATKRPGSEESLFPLHRMPFGMVEYQIEFFSATNIMQVCFLIFYY